MRVRVLTTAQAAEWRGYLERLPGADIYHTPEYHAAHEANGDGTALCFVAEEGDNLLLHPFMLRDIPDTGYRDIETVYGYSGSLSTVTEGPFLYDFACHYSRWCGKQGVAAEFVRFNPLSRNHDCYSLDCLTQDRETVVLSLTPGDLRDRYTATARNKVRKAERAGCIVSHSGYPWEFWRLYDATMERNGAAGYYYFSDAYRSAIGRALGDWCHLFNVWHDGRIVAAGLYLTHGDRLHYHLAGSDETAKGSGAVNLLLHEAALWGQAHGYRYLHLGGGRTSDPHDSLLRFKASISRERLPFYVGKRIHNLRAYNDLCEEWLKRHPGQDGGGYFLLWRKE